MADLSPLEQRIALCVITGDDWRDNEVMKLLSSAMPHVDGLFVNFNGTSKRRSRNPKSWKRWTDKPIVVERFEWEDDFAKARQQSFSLVPRDRFDWYLWLDVDDVLMVTEPFSELFTKMDQYTKGFHMKYEYAIEPKTGAVVVEQWRERLLSTDVDWHWLFPVHEVARAPLGVQWGSYDSVYVRHQRTRGEDRGARDRNRRIIAKAMKEDPNESRYIYYMANETLSEADDTPPGPARNARAMMTIELYRKFMSVGPAGDDYYNAQLRIGEAYSMMREHNKAMDAYLQAVKIYPSWASGYLGVARECMAIGEWSRMRSFADIAVNCPKPTTASAMETQHATFQPIFLRGIANEELGNIADALNDYKKAAELWLPPPNEGETESPLTIKIAELDKKMNVEGQELALREGWVSSADFTRNARKGTKPEKSICFFTNRTAEAWHPKLDAERGSGGAERMIMELAPMFAADGWRVAVFGDPAEHRGLDIIEWWRSDEWTSAEPFTVFVGSRAPNAFEGSINAKAKLLWLHDVVIPGAVGTVRPDAYICLTEWHKQHTSRVHNINADRILVIPNGVHVDDILSLPPDKEPHRFVWSSSYDRGLDNLLGLWPTVREMWPDAEVYVHYGWDLIDAVTRGYKYHPLGIYKARCLAMHEAIGGEDAGFHLVGRVPKEQLWEAQRKSSAWLYPTTFMETFCITAVECQLAGAIPVTTKLAGLTDTVAMKELLVDGWPKNVTYQNEWLKLLERVVDDEDFGGNMRSAGSQHALQYDWENVYARWRNVIDEVAAIEPVMQAVMA
jgi:glycosyltransferase involved in cell wall biosynthesis/tetratricopeptide (TPR) repeat protein